MSKQVRVTKKLAKREERRGELIELSPHHYMFTPAWAVKKGKS